MANLPEGPAQFEFQKMQFVSSLTSIAEQMRAAASLAEGFANTIAHIPYATGIPAGQFGPAVVPNGRKRKSRDGEDGDGRRKRGLKKIKDPNAPKRPPSSYLLFQNEVRSELKAKNPDIPNNELLTMIAKKWASMSKEEKEQYEQRQKAAKDQYLAEKSVYDNRSSPVNGATAAAAQPAATPEAKSVATAAPTATSEEETSEEEEQEEREPNEEGSSSEQSSEEDVKPAPKKSKPSRHDEVKEKKHKKSKA